MSTKERTDAASTYVLCKTLDLGNGATSNRYISGKDGTDYTHRSTNAKTWKTLAGARRWVDARGGIESYRGYQIVEIFEGSVL